MGMYGASLARWLDAAGRVHVIPATEFYRDQGATVDALLGVWQSRSGSQWAAPSQAGGPAEEQTRANHHAHPKLEDDVTNPVDRAALSALFRESNQQVYRLAREDERVSVLPHGVGSGRYDAAFLDAVWGREAR